MSHTLVLARGRPRSRPETIPAVLVTPVTFAIDVALSPVYVLWVVMTAGGHGHCWLPWCE